MSPVGVGPSGTYQSAGTSYPSPQSIVTEELRTVTVLPQGSSGGPPNTLMATEYRLKMTVPTMLSSVCLGGAVAAVSCESSSAARTIAKRVCAPVGSATSTARAVGSGAATSLSEAILSGCAAGCDPLMASATGSGSSTARSAT